jgi:23S rRNA pseudouridine1911/1915/1917 synthase
MEKFKFEVLENEVGIRVDKFLATHFLSVKSEVTRSKIKGLIESGAVSEDGGKPVKSASAETKFVGQIFEVTLPDARESHLKAKQIDFEIVFEDDDLLVINKPAGLTVHPGSGNADNTLVNALLFTHAGKLSSINGEMRPGIVHRLDKDTSGLMLVAKNDFTHQILTEDLKNRDISRSYLAFVYGVVEPRRGRIEKNIVRSRVNRLKMKPAKISGRFAATNYETKQVFLGGYISLIECKLDTGRTHQIRVHMESIKHSLVGDQLYNSCKKNPPKELAKNIVKAVESFPRQALHSYKIGFLHPRTKEEMSFEIGLPEDLKGLESTLSS